jgi:ankyrin repeat protein
MTFIRIVRPLVFVLLPLAVIAQNTKQDLNDQMWEAVRRGDAPAVTALLDKGADVNAKFRYGTTALFKAAERGNVDVVKVLLAHGADVTVKDTFYGATAMTWALDHDHVDIVQLLLQKDASSVDDVLMTGVREKKPQLVKIALDRGVKPASLTAALGAAQGGEDKNDEIVDMLKKAGAIPPPDVDAATLQSYAGKYKSEQGLEINVTTKDGKLFAAAAGQQTLRLMAVDKVTFKPAEFDGLVLTFNVDAGKANGVSLKQGSNTTQLKRVEEVKP